MQIVNITLTQLANMFFFMAIGYVFRKKNILDVYAGGTVSRLLVNVFLPLLLRSYHVYTLKRHKHSY